MKAWKSSLRWRWPYLLWLLLPLVFWLIFRQVPWNQIWAALRRISLFQLTVLLGLNLAITLLFSSRWWLILAYQGYRRPYLALAAYRLAAFAVSYFTPGTQFGGEPLQVYLLQKRQGVPLETAAASVGLDKIFELLANFTFLAVGLVIIVSGGWLTVGLGPASLGWAALPLGVPLVYLFMLWRAGRLATNGSTSAHQAPLTRLTRGWSEPERRPWQQRAAGLVASAEAQMMSLVCCQPLAVFLILALSGLVWVLSILEYGLLLAFLDTRLNLSQVIVALTAARLAFLTPLPGGLGALEASQALALEALGYPAALGISVSLLMRARDVMFGLVGLWLGAWLARLPVPPAQAGNPVPFT